MVYLCRCTEAACPLDLAAPQVTAQDEEPELLPATGVAEVSSALTLTHPASVSNVCH
jgi:hypothetical protein